MTKTITLTPVRRVVLINALSAEITSLLGIVEDESETPTEKAIYGAQLKAAKHMYKMVGGQ